MNKPVTSPQRPLRQGRHGAAHVRHRVLRSRDRFWRTSDFSEPRSTASHALADLVAQGELITLRKGLYWRGTPTPLGMSRPPVEAVVRQVARGPGVGPAGLSAANLLRVSTQVPRLAEVAVPGRAPEAIGPVRFVGRQARTARREAKLTPAEVAVLEVLLGWDQLVEGDPSEAWSRLAVLIKSDAVRPDALGRGARTEPAAVRARLDLILRESGFDHAASRIPPADARSTARALSAKTHR